MTADHSPRLDPAAQRRISATIKFPQSANYKQDNPWLVFESSDPEIIKDLIASSFGIEEKDDLTLADVVLEAQQQATASGNAVHGLSAKSFGGGGRAKGASADAFAAARNEEPAAPAEPERDPLYDSIEESEDIPALQTLWSKNRAAFDSDAELFAAWKAKGKALSAK